MKASNRERILELTYELEGLLTESLSRDEVPALMLRLISDKIAAIASLADLEEHCEHSENSEHSENYEHSDSSDNSNGSDGSDSSEEVISPLIQGYSLEDDENEVFSDPDSKNSGLDSNFSENASETPIENQEVTEEDVNFSNPASKNADFAESFSAPEKPAEKPRKPSRAPIFSLNDRFLYSRELFGGSVQEFERALTQVASMESYEEAEEYFYTEHGFDPENPVVADFLIVVASYFD